MVLVGLCEVVSEDTKTGLLLSAAENDMAIRCISMAFVVYLEALLEHADTTLLQIRVKCCY
jgi:hypothetical protein